MKLCFLVLGCVIAASAWPVDQHSVRVHGINGWYVPQKEGGLRWVGKTEAERQLEYYDTQDALNGRLFSNSVNFYLYTLNNPSTGQQIKTTKASIDASFFNPSNPTRITIHGWNSNYRDGVNTRVAEAWFQYGDYNMIAVDWSRGRSLEYATSVSGAPGAGKKIAALVDFLVEEYGMRLDTLEVVGFSLGAHVAGHTAKQVTTGRVGKVVGLDPASPFISYSKTEKRLSSDDAEYVESIQTNGAILGFTQPIGKAAFFMNGGRSQPGCGIDITGSCSHTRAVLYYVEALLWNNFPSKKCETYQDANKNACGDTYSSILMGAVVNAIVAEGIFYVPVNKQSPYGYGEINNGGEETTAAPAVTTTEQSTTGVPEDSTTEEPEEASTTPKKPEEPSTPKEPEESTTADPEESTTDEPEEVSTTTRKPEEPSTTAEPEESTTAAPQDSTTEEPEEVSTTPKKPEETSTTEEPEESTAAAPEDSTTEEPEEVSTTPKKPDEPSTTEEPEETTTADPEESTTEEPEEVSTTTRKPEEPSTTVEPEESTTAAPEDSTTEQPEEVSTTTRKPEEPSTTVEPEESTTEEPEETTKKSEEETTGAPEESTTPPPEDGNSTTDVPEDISTTAAPEVPTTTAIPTERPSTTAVPEVPTTTVAPEIPPTNSPIDDNTVPGGTKNIFIFNVFLVNVKVDNH